MRRVRTTISSTYSHPFQVHYLIHKPYLTNHFSFLELLECGTHCHSLLSLNPTICHLSNLTSTNLILSPFLLKLLPIFSAFPLSGLCFRPYGLSPKLLTKGIKNTSKAKTILVCCCIFITLGNLSFMYHFYVLLMHRKCFRNLRIILF